eukprot:CAMPEP_0177572656 /NCGR_PEP_ID=MMETSP0369-20130122/78082_1 /TAXON_ID=447022 ORGANISM="Scrippsiella hangoei-like, Strain SHHI-4" /NCGR_SAMPLE_ID=MMETSP0369 /ASSEMBLY_ACC=CAM_ASM_000364 /LENGTH=160 /DNA_ID=CAMNT_0019060659 /DNA_START=12 /DNA_END=491 /DNA_ORIENTATION=+
MTHVCGQADAPQGQAMALIQLIVNYYKDGESSVRAHRHRCRQVCASIGAPRDVEVEGRGTICMQSGDCLSLAGEEHSVPPAARGVKPRMSVCLFYATRGEYDAGAGVLTKGSQQWAHPDDEHVEPGSAGWAAAEAPLQKPPSHWSPAGKGGRREGPSAPR